MFRLNGGGLIFGFGVSFGVLMCIVGCFLCDIYLFFWEFLREVNWFFWYFWCSFVCILIRFLWFWVFFLLDVFILYWIVKFLMMKMLWYVSRVLEEIWFMMLNFINIKYFLILLLILNLSIVFLYIFFICWSFFYGL